MLQHARAFALLPSSSDQIPVMPTYTGRHDLGKPQSLVGAGEFNKNVMPYWVARAQPGYRVVQFRWVLSWENDPGLGGDLIRTLKRGRYDISRDLRMMRPVARELRRQGLALDGIYVDNEGGFDIWTVSPQTIDRIFDSAVLRLRLPPSVRSIPKQKLYWSRPGFDIQAANMWNAFTRSLNNRALRELLIDSRLFDAVRTPGGQPTPPVVNNYNWCSPTWTCYDYNGWALSDIPPIDGCTSNWNEYFSPVGQRYRQRTHDIMWNKLIDICNIARSCLARPNGRFWPTVAQPIRNNPWLWEQMIAHLTRTGVNWTATKSAFVYFNEMDYLGPQSDPLAAQILARHDQPFPVQRNLPEIPLDADQIETAGYVTTYQQFLENVPLTPFTRADDELPIRIFPSVPLRAVA